METGVPATASSYCLLEQTLIQEAGSPGALALGSSHRNNALYKTDGTKVISDGELTAMTLMIAESVPKEKEIMTTMVMNFLTI